MHASHLLHTHLHLHVVQEFSTKKMCMNVLSLRLTERSTPLIFCAGQQCAMCRFTLLVPKDTHIHP